MNAVQAESGQNDGPVEFLDSSVLADAEATNQRPALSDDGEELKTITRLPAITPPPPSVASPLPSFPPPATAPSIGIAAAGHAAHREPVAPASSKPSWLAALLSSTVPPPATERTSPAAPVSPTVAGAVFVTIGLAFAIVSLVTGLRGAPADGEMAPAVAAALVIGRALVALGAGALSFVMLLRAERLLVKSP
jgi:hypothetical protein